MTQGVMLERYELTGIAACFDCTPAQVLLAWSLQKGHVVLVGSTNVKHIQENFVASDITLTAEHVSALDALEAGYISQWNPIVDHPVLNRKRKMDPVVICLD